ncbi:MAG: hypothetical protein R2825_25440 [Saprospiraceae bacterium]
MIAQSVSNEPSHDELFREIANMDEVLFNAFNNGDMDKIKTLSPKI